MKAGMTSAYDADLKGYFDSIPHDKLLACIRMRVVDRNVLNLIKMWLRSPVYEKDDNNKGTKITHPTQGCPQGGLCEASHNDPYAKEVIMRSNLLSALVIK
jgi:RNA-directed DNA polymerase